jgi:hypothetical protein
MDALRQIRVLAAYRTLGLPVGPEQLIQAALDAYANDADSPSLAELASLTRGELPEADRLFRNVVEELGLAPDDLPGDPRARRCEKVRRWARLVADGDLDPPAGGFLIWSEGWSWLDHPDELLPIVSATMQYEDHTTEWTADEQTAAALAVEIRERVREFLRDSGG